MNDDFLHVSIIAMIVLGIWGGINLILGIVYSRRKDTNKAFWQMTAGWGMVNLLLAALTLIRLLSQQVSTVESINSQLTIIKVNIILDIVYVFVGVVLSKRSRASARAIGFGRAIVLQGLFLFVFDIVLVLALSAAR